MKRKKTKTLTKEQEIRALHKVLERVETVLLLSDPNGDRAKHIHAPEDPEILALCERIGFGAVMDSAARQWRTKSDLGAISAHTTGAAVGTLRLTLKQVRDALERRFE